MDLIPAVGPTDDHATLAAAIGTVSAYIMSDIKPRLHVSWPIGSSDGSPVQATYLPANQQLRTLRRTLHVASTEHSARTRLKGVRRRMSSTTSYAFTSTVRSQSGHDIVTV